MISVNGWDLWTWGTFTDLMTWFGKNGFNDDDDAQLLAALLNGDPGPRAERPMREAMERLREKLPSDAPDWIPLALDFGSTVLREHRFPDEPT